MKSSMAITILRTSHSYQPADCETDPFDRGWHVLIGEKDYRGKPFITAWLPSLFKSSLGQCRPWARIQRR